MTRHSILSALLVLALLLLSGCANVNRMTEGRQTAFGGAVQFDAPVGWVRADANSQLVVVTRDGGAIQHIAINYGSTDKVLAKTKPVLGQKRLPLEVAEMVVAERRALLGNAPFNLKESVPATIAGREGFVARGTFRNERGAPYEVLIAGAVVNQDTIVTVTYQALAVHFFNRDKPAFDALLGSLQVTR